MRRLRQALETEKSRLLKLPNVVGVGIGHKSVRGKLLDDLALVVMVERKLRPEELEPEAIVPARVGRNLTDVIEVGRILPQSSRRRGEPFRRQAGASAAPAVPPQAIGEHRLRARPAVPGTSIGHYAITAGTFGAVVWDRQTRRPLILSNNHVLANATSGRDGRAHLGDAVLQPGPYDGGRQGGPRRRAGDAIASLARYIPLRRRSVNLADAALASPASDGLISPEILEVGAVRGQGRPRLRLAVKKSGRTTGLTRGVIRAMHATLSINYPQGLLTFTDQIICTAMSEGGDSGSLVLDEQNRAVGLLFAGSDRATVCNPIGYVLGPLKVTLVPPRR